jgi:hypothetical protein
VGGTYNVVRSVDQARNAVAGALGAEQWSRLGERGSASPGSTLS